jgi:putative sugar O-methyltransferase
LNLFGRELTASQVRLEEDMGFRALARTLTQRLLQRYAHSIVPNALLYEWQKPTTSATRGGFTTQAPGADRYLTKDNARLRELEEAYAQVKGPVTTPSVWTADHVRAIDLQRFRADDAYLWQHRGRDMNEMSFGLAYYYLKSIDRLRLLDRLDEDQAFGVNVFGLVEGRPITRDLLDSVAELNFLERHLALSQREAVVILDIGAGYGRLAYRSMAALPSIRQYLCADAVPVSTFICEHYLRYRGVDRRAQVIPLHELSSALRSYKVDLAINIHSFSECRVKAIAWWLALLREHKVPNLMVVPNVVGTDGTSMLTIEGENFSTVLADHGYRLVAQEPKYLDPVVQKYGPCPAVHCLFELRP